MYNLGKIINTFLIKHHTHFHRVIWLSHEKNYLQIKYFCQNKKNYIITLGYEFLDVFSIIVYDNHYNLLDCVNVRYAELDDYLITLFNSFIIK